MVVGKNNLPNGGGSVVMIYHIRIRKEMTKKNLHKFTKEKSLKNSELKKNKNTTMDMFLLVAP